MIIWSDINKFTPETIDTKVVRIGQGPLLMFVATGATMTFTKIEQSWTVSHLLTYPMITNCLYLFFNNQI